jgi:hypothetical protein
MRARAALLLLAALLLCALAGVTAAPARHAALQARAARRGRAGAHGLGRRWESTHAPMLPCFTRRTPTRGSDAPPLAPPPAGRVL